MTHKISPDSVTVFQGKILWIFNIFCFKRQNLKKIIVHGDGYSRPAFKMPCTIIVNRIIKQGFLKLTDGYYFAI